MEYGLSMEKILLIKYGEIALRGKNRKLFEDKLLWSIADRIQSLEGYRINKEQGRLVISNREGCVDYELLLPRIRTVPGIWAFCPALSVDNQDIDYLKEIAVQYMKENYGDAAFTFKVETKRADKRYPLNSQEISSIIGGAINNALPCAAVDVKNPQEVLHVELRNRAYLFGKVIRGEGGLPQNSSGKGMLLLSGGIDSPVAGYMMAKRGVGLYAVYYHSAPYTSERAKEKVLDLAKRLSDYVGKIKLFVVDFTDIQLYLYEQVDPGKRTIFMKRAMLSIAEKLAVKEHCQCLITGDSVGQVASQTLQSILAVDSAASIPILRPLAGLDKQEIVDISQRIETYDISIRPFEDCCTIFTAKHPETKPLAPLIAKIESRLQGFEEKKNYATDNCETIEIESKLSEGEVRACIR